MSSVDIRQPFTIHLGVDELQFERLRDDARSRAMDVFELDIEGIPDREALGEYLAESFRFPHATSGLDAAIDLLSDLEWFGNEHGYLILARGMKDSSDTSEIFASMLPVVVDWWRRRGVPFIVVIDGRGIRLRSALATANREMERQGNLSWAQPGTGSVNVVVHGAAD